MHITDATCYLPHQLESFVNCGPALSCWLRSVAEMQHSSSFSHIRALLPRVLQSLSLYGAATAAGQNLPAEFCVQSSWVVIQCHCVISCSCLCIVVLCCNAVTLCLLLHVHTGADVSSSGATRAPASSLGSPSQ